MAKFEELNIGDWVTSDYGEGKITQKDDKYLYVTHDDGEYYYYFAFQLEKVEPSGSNDLWLIEQLLDEVQENEKAFELVLQLAANLGIDIDDTF